MDVRVLLRFRALPDGQRQPYEVMAAHDEAQDRLGGHPAWTPHWRELRAARYWAIQTGEYEENPEFVRP